ncbi:unnamed protein product [Lymnaea stagnalis]|uniref:Uncharacterized protein n=1 Tax=Lymnaea stagnalis TaxID=6523 RepID=A0AAV2HFY3_LYMST
MEFLSALQKAVQMGLTKEEFIPLWNHEMKQRVSNSQGGVPVHHVEERGFDGRISTTIVDGVVREIQGLKHESFKLEEAASDLRKAAFNISTEAEETLTHALQELVNSTQERLHAFRLDVKRCNQHVYDTLGAALLKFENSLRGDIEQLTGVCEARQDLEQLTIHDDKHFKDLFGARVVAPQSTHPREASVSLKQSTPVSEARVEKTYSTNPIARETEHVGDQGLTRTGATIEKATTISKRDNMGIQSDARTQEDEQETEENLPAPNDTPLNDHQKWMLRENMMKREFERFGHESSELSSPRNYTSDGGHLVYYPAWNPGGIMETGNDFYTFSDPVFVKEAPIEIKLVLHFSYGKFKVSMWYKSLELNSFKTARRFRGSGKIENRNSGVYSELFTMYKGGFKSLTKNETGQIDAEVCLKTSRGSYDDVTIETLENRNYTTLNMMFISWSISFEEE